MFIRRATIVVAFAVASLGLLVGSASASHAGALVTCDNGDTFTIRAVNNSGGFQSPAPDHVLVFEEGAVLTVHRLSVDGNLVLSRADTGQANNALTEVTCSFTIGAGLFFEVTGILNVP
jgi:hypothetical protein